MSLVNLGLISVAILNAGMAILILLRNPKNKINISFFLTILCVALWSLFQGLVREAKTEPSGFLLAIAGDYSAFLISVFFFIFSFYFPYQSFQLRTIYKVLVFLVGVSVFYVVSQKFYVGQVIVQPPNTDFITQVFGRVYYSFFFMVFTVGGFYLLVKKYLASEGAMRQSLFSVILATGIIGSVGTVFGTLLTAVTGRNNAAFVPYFSIPMVLVLIWFIFRKT